MLHLVTGEVEIHHYMVDRPEREKFLHLIEGENDDEVRAIVELLYELQGSPYATSYLPTIHNIETPISMATIQEMQNAKNRR
jgi:hypothetical protein